MTIYRSYDIVPHEAGGFTWTDERNFTHYAEGVTKVPYVTEEAAMNDIDQYKRNMAKA
jgi:hypothetical protein